MDHVLYETGDPEAPGTIKDRNGEVVLGLCKICGAGEIELLRLGGKCPGKRRLRRDNAGVTAHAMSNSIYLNPDPDTDALEG